MKVDNATTINEAMGINTEFLYYEINKKRNVEFSNRLTITHLYESVLKGGVKVGDIVNVYLERNTKILTKCQLTEWEQYGNDVTLRLFDIVMMEEVSIKYVK